MKRLSSFLFCLPVFLFIWSCSGGGGPEAAKISSSGQVCVSSENQYTITDSQTGESQTITAEEETLLTKYLFGMGGQIRAVASTVMSVEDAEPVTMLMWGSGSSIQYATGGMFLGPLALSREGAVTDMVSYGKLALPKIFFGTERGIGVAEVMPDDTRGEGVPPYKMLESIYKPVPPGVLSVAVLTAESKTRLFFVTGDGYVLTINEEDFLAGGSCYDIISSKTVLTDGATNFMPVKVAVTSSKAFILAKKSLDGGLAPTFAQTYDPILQTLMTGEKNMIARAVDLSTNGVEEIAVKADTGGYKGFDQFIPTDVAGDGTNLYIAGLAYDKATVDSFYISTCDKASAAENLACMRDKAKEGTLELLDTSGGYDAMAGGFFIYRDLAKTGETAAHFTRIPINTVPVSKSGPPLIFHMTVKEDRAAFRAPNFLVAPMKSVKSGKEDWTIGATYDENSGLIIATPANLNIYSVSDATYIAATSVGAKGDDGSGASSLEMLDGDGVLTILDTGSTKIRMEDAKKPYLAAIDTLSNYGGALYLENPDKKNFILASTSIDAFISRAAYDGTYLAFAWSEPGAPWRIDIQKGVDGATRGEYTISKDGDSRHYVGFPDVDQSNSQAFETSRSILDMKFAEGRLFVLFYGFNGGKHYYQAGAYGASLTDGKYKPALLGIINTISFNGDEIDANGRFQKITKNTSGQFTAIFSCAGGLRQFAITPASSVPSVNITSLFSAPNVIDLDFDDAGTKFAFVSSKTIFIRDTSDYSRNVGSTSVTASESETSRLSNASLVMTSKNIFISTPVGASAPFWIIDISNAVKPKVASKCASCRFNGLAIYPDFENQLLACSETGGVEVYDITGM